MKHERTKRGVATTVERRRKKWLENERMEKFSHHGLQDTQQGIIIVVALPCFMVTRFQSSFFQQKDIEKQMIYNVDIH